MAVEEAITKEIVEAYIEHFLAPTLKPGEIVVMDCGQAPELGILTIRSYRPEDC